MRVTQARGVARSFVATMLAVLGAGAPLPAADATQRVRERAARALAELDAPGLSAAIVLHGELFWAEGFGLADVENAVPARADTVYRIASLSKPLAATAVLQLVEAGEVGLDDPVQRHVPGFPAKPWPVTVRQLLAHTAGIRHYRAGEFSSTRHYDSVEAALSVFQDDPLLFEPGTGFEYSSYGYNLLAAVVERASGMEFERYMRESVWGPAEMSRTALEQAGEIVPGRARAYVKGDGPGEWRNAPLADLSVKWAAGGMIGSVADLARFSIALDEGRLLGKPTLEKMYEEQHLRDGTPTGYGLGWAVARSRDRRRLVGHEGGATGGSSFLMRLPDEGHAVALLVNVSDAGDLYGLARALLAAALDEPEIGTD